MTGFEFYYVIVVEVRQKDYGRERIIGTNEDNGNLV